MAIVQSTILPLEQGRFRIAYHKTDNGDCISVSYGNLQNKTPIIRLHSSCLFGESFQGLDCDCRDQLTSTLKLINKNRSGVVVYRYNEGRGIGLEAKIKALELQRTKKINTVEAFELLGFRPDPRTYEAELTALKDLRINSTIHAASQNPNKLAALRSSGYTIEQELHPLIRLTKHNIHELLAKKEMLGHSINLSIHPEADNI